MITVRKYNSKSGVIIIREDRQNKRVTMDCGNYGFRCQGILEAKTQLKNKYPDAQLFFFNEVEGEWE